MKKNMDEKDWARTSNTHASTLKWKKVEYESVTTTNNEKDKQIIIQIK